MAKKALAQKGGGINMPLFKSIMKILMPVDPLGIKKAVGLGFPAGGGINMPLFKSIMQILMPVNPLRIKKAVGLGFPSNASPSYESFFPGNENCTAQKKAISCMEKAISIPPPANEYDNRAPPTYRQLKSSVRTILLCTLCHLKEQCQYWVAERESIETCFGPVFQKLKVLRCT